MLLGIENLKFAQSFMDLGPQSLSANSTIGVVLLTICSSLMSLSTKYILTCDGARVVPHTSLLSQSNPRDNLVSSLSNFMAIKVKGFGWRKELPDHRDYTPEHEEVKKIVTENGTKTHKKLSAGDLPKAIDNRQYCSPIEDQGQLGSCTANAGVGMYEYMENKANGTYIDGSRLFLYKATRLLMGDEGKGDSGAYIRTTLGAIRLFGIPNEEYWPYTDEETKFDIMPDPC